MVQRHEGTDNPERGSDAIILASHQPNFAPYMGFFYKMYCADMFAFADTVKFSRTEYQNYNYLDMHGDLIKVTVPVKSHSEPINRIRLHNASLFTKKFLKTLRHAYSRAKYFDEVYSLLEGALNNDFDDLLSLNLSLINSIKDYFEIRTKLYLESSVLEFNKSPEEDISAVCNGLGANVYLSGQGGKKYLNDKALERNGISVKYSMYQGEEPEKSSIDYMMKNGKSLPAYWAGERERLHEIL